MRVGSIVFATQQGLGILAKSFYDNGLVTDVCIVKHKSRKNHLNWYPNSQVVNHRNPINQNIVNMVRAVDLMIFFETPFNWDTISLCNRLRVPTILIPMYECMPETLPQQPTHFLCPSELDKQYYPTNSTYLPIPVDVTWNKRKVARNYLHNAGHLGLNGRNGTLELMQAMEYVKSDLRLTIRCQTSSLTNKITNFIKKDPRVRIYIGEVPKEDLYSTDYEVFVFPEKFNGLSLPLQEAYASGMLVMATDRFPMSNWLPHAPLISRDAVAETRVARSTRIITESRIDPKTIAETMDRWYDKPIANLSCAGQVYGMINSWDNLKPKYEELFERVIHENFVRR